MRFARLTIPTCCLLLTLACGGPTPQTPASSPDQASPQGAASGVVELGDAVVNAPADWTFVQPSSSMRLAEATVPGPGGPALLTVFFFGSGGGGGVGANLQRWVGQVEAEEGTTPVQQQFTVDGYSISTVSVSGTLLPSTMGAGPAEPIPGSRLLGAVIEGPGGPWFLKLTGPKETVDAAQEAFDAMLRSVRGQASTA